MSRMGQATAAREVLGEDFFGGWVPEDAALLARHAYAVPAINGMITDFMGVRTCSSFHPLAVPLHGTIVGELPIPDDSLRAETIEYFAMLTSLEAAPPDRFSFVELGAAYAPWSCTAAVLAQRSGRSSWQIVAVEASKYLFDLIPQHLAENDIDPADSRVRLIHGAVASERGILKFPRVDRPDELGSQASVEAAQKDYLGRVVDYEDVEAYPLVEMLPPGTVDMVHVDVQGVEHAVLKAAIDVLDKRVKSVFVGTHSRKIEGDLIDLFHGHGWRLIRERPTKFGYASELADPVAWTTRDGGQYWVNPRLVSPEL